jgi:hypothetical protein
LATRSASGGLSQSVPLPRLLVQPRFPRPLYRRRRPPRNRQRRKQHQQKVRRNFRASGNRQPSHSNGQLLHLRRTLLLQQRRPLRTRPRRRPRRSAAVLQNLSLLRPPQLQNCRLLSHPPSQPNSDTPSPPRPTSLWGRGLSYRAVVSAVTVLFGRFQGYQEPSDYT